MVRGPGAMTRLHQEQGYGGSESRSAEKVEAAGFLLRSTAPLHSTTSRKRPGQIYYFLQIFNQISCIHSNVILPVCQLYLYQFINNWLYSCALQTLQI